LGLALNDERPACGWYFGFQLLHAATGRRIRQNAADYLAPKKQKNLAVFVPPSRVSMMKHPWQFNLGGCRPAQKGDGAGSWVQLKRNQ
jgi:hypothetical protein